jgi:NifU-like protein involved in Fe-S cluster formation
MYSEKVMCHFRKPRHAGEIRDADGTGQVGNAACGDVMRVQIKVKDGKIVDAKFQTFGCCAAIASSDAVCELVRGKRLGEASRLSRQDIVEYLGGLPDFKVHCSILGTEALKKAIQNYKERCGRSKLK